MPHGNINPPPLHQGEDFEVRTKNTSGEAVVEVNSSALEIILGQILIQMKITNMYLSLVTGQEYNISDIEE